MLGTPACACWLELPLSLIRALGHAQVADELVWALRSEPQPPRWAPAQLFKHTSLCRHEVGRRVAGFECVEFFHGSSSAPPGAAAAGGGSGQLGRRAWVRNHSSCLRPFEVNQARHFTGQAAVVGAMQAVWREQQLRAFLAAAAAAAGRT